MHISAWILPAIYFSSGVVAFYPYETQEKVEPVAKADDKAARRSLIVEWFGGGQIATRGAKIDVPTLNIRRKAPPDDGDTHLNYIRELNYISAKYQARGTPQPAPVKRANGYKIVTASQPSQSASLAVNQDGTDFSYFSTLKFGSSGKSMNMLVDTGAANTWVMGEECPSKACIAHNTFGPADSETLQSTDTPWTVTYGTGKVSGIVVNDTVSMAGFTLPLGFGAASETSDDFLTYPMDGILGLGRSKSNVMGTPTVMEALEDANLLKEKLIGVNLQRYADGATDGVVNFGMVDTSKFTGDLSYTKSISKDGLWEVPVDDAGVDNNGCKFSGKTAIIDTGTSFVLMPPNDAKKLLSQIPRAQPKGETFTIPCSSTAAIQLTFSGVTYNISSKDYLGKTVDGGNMCNSNIIGRQTFGANQWLIGDAFLKNVYTVFDFDKNRIGFGEKSSAKSSQTTSSSSTSGQSFSISSSLVPSSVMTASSSEGPPIPSPLLAGSVGATTYPASASGTSTAAAATDTVSGPSQSPSRTYGSISATAPAAAMSDPKASSAQPQLLSNSVFIYLTILLIFNCI